MSKHEPTSIEQADEFTANALHTMAQRIVELEAANTAMVNALTRFRGYHDMRLWPHERPCTCGLCVQANEAIAAAKGGA